MAGAEKQSGDTLSASVKVLKQDSMADLSRTTTTTRDLMTKPSTWDTCIYAAEQHCPCDGVCAVTRKLAGGADEEAQLAQLEDEVRRNGFAKVLTHKNQAGEEGHLRDVAAQKHALPENRPPSSPAGGTPRSEAAPHILNRAEILAVILYTGSDIQGRMRQDMMAAGGSKWPVFSATLERALKKQRVAGTTVKRNHFECDLVLYHGLHGVNVGDFERLIEGDGTFAMTFSIGTVVSASYNRDISMFFACGAGGTAQLEHHKGLLLEMTCRAGRWPACADVAWMSKFPHEEEVVIAP